MTEHAWRAQLPISKVFFDCDGTLSSIEGIDELAKYSGVGDVVSSLTAEAMSSTGLNPELYKRRLELVKPTHSEVNLLGEQYYIHRTQDIEEVLRVLFFLKKSIYIISAGLLPAVVKFGEILKIPKKNIFAVDVKFDEKGNYLDFDHSNPLVTNNGKKEIISNLSDIIYVGDGLNDITVIPHVKKFIGYGGHFYRENIAAVSHHYIKCASMAALLPLILTSEEYVLLNDQDKEVFDKGVNLLRIP